MRTYFAQLNENNIVTDVHCVTQEFIDANPERYTGTWVKTFIDDTHTYAGVGYTYSYDTQDFTSPYIEPAQPADEP